MDKYERIHRSLDWADTIFMALFMLVILGAVGFLLFALVSILFL